MDSLIGIFRKSLSKFLLVVFFVLAALSLSMGYSLQEEVRKLLAERNISNNLVFFLLINLNIAVLTVLAFLVIQNIVRLVLDRRRNILGSKLRSRLVVAFVGLSLVPTVILFIVSRGILSSVMAGWFSPQISASVEGAVGVAKLQFEAAQAQVQRNVNFTSKELAELSPYVFGTSDKVTDPRSLQLLQDYLDRKREEYGLLELAIVDPDGLTVVRAADQSVSSEQKPEIPGLNMRAVRDAVFGSTVVRAEQTQQSEFLRVYAGLPTSPTAGVTERIPLDGETVLTRENQAVDPSGKKTTEVVPNSAVYGADNTVEIRYPSHFVLIGTLWFPPELNSALSQVLDSYDDYMELKTYRRPLASSYVLSLVVVTIMIVFAAIWVGFYLARGLSGPIHQLAQGTDQIAQGNLDYRIPEVSDDELGVLVSSFNRMTEDLKLTTTELVARRRYMEAILANVGVGVISLDEANCITTFNRAASDILGVSACGQGVHFRNALPKELADSIDGLLNDLATGQERSAGGNVSAVLGGTNKNIQLGLTRLVDEQGKSLGSVVLLDDLTDLVNAQRMAAWQDVARRIAHEIKNPLTPIQLSAERIQRRVTGATASAETVGLLDTRVISDCTNTIINQVEALRGLVNEFSRFARMPKSNPRMVQLNDLISETEAIFREAHPRIEFLLQLDSSLPEIELDRDQIGRVLVNLLDNAVASIDAARNETVESVVQGELTLQETGELELASRKTALSDGFIGQIVIKSLFDSGLGLVAVQVADSGVGISDSDKPKLFEPYFSKRKGGTGLGLAIVGSIVADHNGFIRVRDNKPKGAVFVVELPVRYHPQVVRQAG